MNNNKIDATPAEHSMFLASASDNTGIAYNIVFAYELIGSIDVARLRAAVSSVIKVQPNLRKTFDYEEGVLKAVIHSGMEVNLEEEAILEDLLKDKLIEFTTPFDLSKGPLINLKLIYLPENKLVLLVNTHHIIFDGTSLSVFPKQLIAAYEGSSLNDSLSCESIVEFQNNLRKNAEFKRQTKYWQELLTGDVESLDIPYDFPKLPTIDNSGEVLELNLEKSLIEDIRIVSKKANSSVFSLLFASYSILLSKLSRTEKIVSGIAYSGRLMPGAEEYIGMFVNALPVLTEPSGDKKFLDYVAETSNRIKENSKNQALQLGEIMLKADISPESSSNPLFDFCFNIFRSSPVNGKEISIKSSGICSGNPMSGSVKNNLSLQIVRDADGDDSFKVFVEYRTSLFRESTIKKFLEYYLVILQKVIKGNETLIKDIEIITEKEKNKILNEFNNTITGGIRGRTLVQQFEETANKFPENTALIFESTKYTYKELNENANKLAYTLIARGATEDKVIGLMVNRSAEMIIGLLGILKSGAAYLPIDVDYPADRIEYMLSDSLSEIMVADECFFEKLPEQTIKIDVKENESYSDNSTNPNVSTNPASLAYIIYTSGSTGKPKGVMVMHKGVLNLALSQIENFSVSSDERILQFSSISFDASVEQIWIALLSGAALVPISKPMLLDNEKFEKYVTCNQVTHLHAVPQFLSTIDIKDRQYLKRIIAGGDTCSTALVKKWNRTCDFINEYGPTETTVTSVQYAIKRGDNLKNIGALPIGKAVANTKLYVVNSNMNLCPVGVSGELLIGGDGVARGYLHRNELTTDKFIANPFMTEEDKKLGFDKLYKSGDLTRWLPDGNLEFIGRIDFQVKIRGFRIELGEIENKILEIPKIKDAMVLAPTDENRNRYLCGYYVSANEITKDFFKEFIGKYLPDYMIPDFFIHLKEFPITPNGKVDRKALPKPDISSLRGEYIAPRNDKEKMIADEFSSTLNIAKVGINDNFFELGGSSLRAVDLVSKLLAKGYSITVADIFKYKTVEGLSEFLDIESDKENMPIVNAKVKDYYLASGSQTGMYLTDKMGDLGTTYNIPFIIDINGDLNREQFGLALDRVISRHSIFSTSFEMTDNGVVQKINSNINIKKEFQKANECEIESIAKQFFKPFDLSKSPLLRLKLIKISNLKHILLLDIHHIIFDGASVEVFMSELFDLYNGKRLKKPELQYSDFAEWESKIREAESYLEKGDYWKSKLAGELPLLKLPLDHPRKKEWNYDGAKTHLIIESELSEKLRCAAAKEGATFYMYLMAAFKIMLSKYSRQEEIIVGAAVSGRLQREVQRMIGMFVNMLPVRSYPEKIKTFKNYLSEIKEEVLGLLSNQDYLFSDIVSDLNIKTEVGQNPIYDVGFNYLQEFDFTYDNFDVSISVPDMGTSKFDLNLTVTEQVNLFECTFEYKTKLFSATTMERFKKHFINILEQIVYNPNVKINKISLITTAEKKLILETFNNTAMHYPKDKTVIMLFEETVERFPEKIALVYKKSVLTYRELNQRANQLARLLKNEGIMPETITGILAEPNFDMIISIFAVLKAGGAYLPIAHDIPNERVKFMLEDSNSKILLTTKSLIEQKKIDLPLFKIIVTDDEPVCSDISNIQISSNSKSLAYVIYTSGSTGRPKGVMIENKSLVNLCSWHNRFFDIKEKDNCSKYAGFSFDASVWEIFPPLISGATLHVIDKAIKLDIEKIVNYFNDYKITFAFLPTQFAEMFMERNDVKYLKHLVAAGDKLKKFIPKQYLCHNGYGPSENTVYATDFVVDRKYDNIPIGKPIDNTKAYILDKNLNLCPIGVPGELCLGGEGLARGYLNRPELTEKKFFYHEDFGSMIYRTGDLARWLPDGNIEFLGRIDFQVKIRGFRIELGEIEKKILEISKIEDVVVLAPTDENGNRYLCGYYVSVKEIKKDYFKEFIGKNLPSYMIPDFFIHLNKFPITPNGKVDRKTLPKPDLSQFKTEYIAPETELEKTLAQAFEEVLNVSKVGIKDNFFDLGGSSLKAISVVSKLQTKGLKLSISDIFDSPTLGELSGVISTGDYDLQSKFEAIKRRVAIMLEDLSSEECNKVTTSAEKSYHDSINSIDFNSIGEQEDINNVLLTGATGYLGAYILKELLTSSEVGVSCIIRGKDNDNAQERLASTLGYYFDDNFYNTYSNRIQVLAGDLSEVKLGLSANVYKYLTENINSIVHSAANVSHYGEYETFYKSNVKPVEELVELASIGCDKSLHYISTSSVCTSVNISGVKYKVITENDDPLSLPPNSNIYAKTKLEGEYVTVKARDKGVKSNIYRVGNLVFNSENGKHQKNLNDNGFFKSVEAYLNIGLIPDVMDTNELSCIDMTAKGICRIYDKKNLLNGVYHVYTSEPQSLSEVFLDPKIGANIKKVHYSDFFDRVYERYDTKAFGAFIENMMLHQGWLDEDTKNTYVKVLNTKTTKILEALGVKWYKIPPSIFKEFVLNALKYRIKFLESLEYLKNINEETLYKISSMCSLDEVEGNQFITVEGEKNNYLYFIQNGTAVETKKSYGGWEGVISFKSTGKVLGLDSIANQASSTTLEP